MLKPLIASWSSEAPISKVEATASHSKRRACSNLVWSKETSKTWAQRKAEAHSLNRQKVKKRKPKKIKQQNKVSLKQL